MPEELKKETPMVDIDTSGDDVDVVLKDDDKKIETENLETTPATVTAPEVEIANEGELEDYSDKVKKRIDKLTGKLREAERREQAATEYAKNVHTENQTLQQQKQNLDGNYIISEANRITAETEAAKIY